MDMVPISEQSLRIAMRDLRYWQVGHPERQDFVDWVTRGFSALEASPLRTAEGKSTVFVRAYARSRDGKPHQVGAHTRSAPTHDDKDSGSKTDMAADKPAGSEVVPAMSRRLSPQTLDKLKRGVQGWLGRQQGATPLMPSPRTPEDLIGASRFDKIVGRGIRQSFRGGGTAQREADFRALNPSNVRNVGPDRIVGDLPGNRQVIIRPDSREGLTLEFQELSRVGQQGRTYFTPTRKLRY